MRPNLGPGRPPSPQQQWSYAERRQIKLAESAVTYDYDAFGNLLHSTGSTFNEFLFAGEQFDSDLGLYYNRARYLNVSTGRFWTMDTYEGKEDNPASLHKYLYAGADSVDKADPSGRDFTLVGTLAAAIVLTILVAIPTAHDSTGPGAPTVDITENVSKDPLTGLHKRFLAKIHAQGDAHQFLVVQWIKGKLIVNNGWAVLEHQDNPFTPANFPNWVIDSFSQIAEYPGDPGAASLTKSGSLITLFDKPGSSGGNSYVADLDFRINIYERWKVSNYVSGFQSVDDPKPLLSIPWGFHDSYVVP